MSKVGDVIEKGEPIPADVIGVTDYEGDELVLNTIGHWHSPGFTDPATCIKPLSCGVDVTEYGPLTVTAVREPETPEPEPQRRLRECVENWPDAETGAYDPRCCRFPKSCSATVYDEDRVTEGDLEPGAQPNADAPGEHNPSTLLDLVRQYGHESHKSGVAAEQRDEEADDYHDGKARRLYDRIAELVPQQPVQARDGRDRTWWIHACGTAAPLIASPADGHHLALPACEVSGPWRPLLVGGDPAPETCGGEGDDWLANPDERREQRNPPPDLIAQVMAELGDQPDGALERVRWLVRRVGDQGREFVAVSAELKHAEAERNEARAEVERLRGYLETQAGNFLAATNKLIGEKEGIDQHRAELHAELVKTRGERQDAFAEVERLQAAQPDPLVLSLPEVPDKTGGLVHRAVIELAVLRGLLNRPLLKMEIGETFRTVERIRALLIADLTGKPLTEVFDNEPGGEQR